FTPAVALAAVVTRHPTVVLLCNDRETSGDAGDVQSIRGVLDHQLVTTRRRGWQKISARMIGKPVVVTEDSDQLVEPIVVRRQVRIPDWPIIAESVAALRLEIIGTEAKRDSAPMVGAATDHPRAPPPELR